MEFIILGLLLKMLWVVGIQRFKPLICCCPIAITPSDTAACEGLTSVILGGSSQVFTPTATYSWDYDYNIQPGFDQVDVVNPGYTQIYPIGAYTILLEIVDENGCIDSAFQDIIVFENPEAIIEFGPACEDFPVDFTGFCRG